MTASMRGTDLSWQLCALLGRNDRRRSYLYQIPLVHDPDRPFLVACGRRAVLSPLALGCFQGFQPPNLNPNLRCCLGRCASPAHDLGSDLTALHLANGVLIPDDLLARWRISLRRITCVAHARSGNGSRFALRALAILGSHYGSRHRLLAQWARAISGKRGTFNNLDLHLRFYAGGSNFRGLDPVCPPARESALSCQNSRPTATTGKI